MNAESASRSRLPRHVAIIMDGNGRWAEERGLPRLAGHREGAASVRDVVRAARQIGLEALTLYAFSSQNWARPADEVAGLMELLRDYLVDEHDEIMDNGIRLEAIGDIERLPPLVRDPLDALRAESAGNTSMTLTLALSYGGRESIARAVRRVVADVAAGALDPARIDADCIGSYLPTGKLPPHGLPVRGSRLHGPVEPWQPPRLFTPITKKRSVSTGFPGPIMLSHQPKFVGWSA